MSRVTLKAARVNAGYTQKEVAKMLKVSNKTVSLWECGKTMPKINMVNSICSLYGMSYDDIIFLPNGSL